MPAGTVTFLFTDIEGSTRLVQDLGPRWPAVLEQHTSILSSVIDRHHGIRLRTEGDSVFAVFELAYDAVIAATDAQRELASADWPDGTVMRVRMGVHTGVGTPGAENYVGLDVHRAARIADAAHGGQIVTSEQTAILVERVLPDGLTLHDLGKHRLKDLRDPETIFQVEVAGLPKEFPALRTLDAIPNNLPEQLTPFFGRRSEIEAALRLMERARVVTLTGPGGTGKTRLSLQIAAEMADRFSDGVFFVPLAPVSDSSIVPSVILNVLGLSASSGDTTPEERLLDAMASKSLLMVLDNFEQILDAAGFVSELVRASPRSQFLVSSRAPLRITGEQEMPVPPLDVPMGESVSEALDSEAVQLFEDRARLVRPDFRVDESNLAEVIEIVERLDGLPLAIELVSSRLRHYSLTTILDRLDTRMLSSGAIDLPERQRTIENAIGWSYDLLSPELQTLFSRLAVFAGGARLGQIEDLCVEWQLEVDLLQGLGELVDHSLLSSVEGLDGDRFRMLHVIREFASERLAESGHEVATRRAHLVLFTELAEAAAKLILGHERAHWLNVLEEEHANLRAAIEWGLEHREVDLTLRLTAAMWRFWQTRGHLHEGEKRLESALQLDGGDPMLRAKAVEALGGIFWWRGSIDECVVRYDQALAMQRELGDRGEIANALYNYALALGTQQQTMDQARVLLLEARGIYESIQDDEGLGNVAWGLGNSQLQDGDYEPAVDYLKEAADAYRRAGNEFGLSWSLFELADVGRRLGDLDEAWSYILGAIEIFKRSRDVSGIVLASASAAAIAFASGDSLRAYRLSGAVATLTEESGTDLVGQAFNLVEGLEPETLNKLKGRDRDAFREGLSMTYDETVSYAMSGPVDEDFRT